MLHVLLHMDHSHVPMSSEKIAEMLNTHPVVIRRTLGNLRSRGYVEASKGHGGGWVLARPLSEISLYDVYEALGKPGVFALGLSNDSPGCHVEKAVNSALSVGLKAAENLILSQFKDLKLSKIGKKMKGRVHKDARI
jgi:DNA-binding IscR family transcriptional regulator